MAGRYLSRNEGAAQRASKNNLWIKYQGVWFHPNEFEYRFGDGYKCKLDEVLLLNPMPVLLAAREKIKHLVSTGAPIAQILNGLKWVNELQDKLIYFGFREQEHQLQQTSWPDEQKPASKSYADKWEEKNRPKPPEPIDYDAIDIIPPED